MNVYVEDRDPNVVEMSVTGQRSDQSNQRRAQNIQTTITNVDNVVVRR